ncbi:succinate dehydrogenase cytochrome b subunit [Psychroflexus sp. ALD_RP9]|nr:succinate dehydrogenase cytochrome b subunit [Psychroflexus sp. ALD_RP9]
MALTGLFLSFFLIIHLVGNLQLLLPEEDAQLQYNWYSELLSGSWFIKIISYGLYASILLHALDALYLTIKARIVSGRYIKDRRNRASRWYARHMMFLGVIIFAFLVIHFKDFWYPYKFGEIGLDADGQKDLYSLVIIAFKDWWYVVLYAVAILALGFHLIHGVFSATRTLGLYNPFYTKIVKVISLVFAILLSLGYLIIPIYLFINN